MFGFLLYFVLSRLPLWCFPVRLYFVLSRVSNDFFLFFCQPAPSPSLCYSLTHAHRSIGYRNRNPQPLADSAARLMNLRVYDSRDSSHQSAPSPSLCYSFTHGHSTLPTPTLITITCTQVLWFLERLTRPAVSFCETTRTRLTICLPTQPSVCESF